MFSSKKLLYLWLAVTVILTVAGYLMAWHGAVYAESAERTNTPGTKYVIEREVGKVLLWPTMVSAKITSSKNINFIFLILLQFFGYFLVFKLVDIFMNRKHNKSLKRGTPPFGGIP
jgi:hypothetical protein